MKSLFLVAMIGLAMGLSVTAQTTTDENQEQKEKAKTEEQAKPHKHKAVAPGVQTKERTETSNEGTVNPKAHEGATINEKTHPQKNKGTRTEAETKTGSAGSVTVFRHGKQTTEHLTLRRSTREQTDVHFSIGTHPRDWWLGSYTVVLMEGCYYYLADNGCWYPAYGFEPGCNYPVGVVFCE